MTAGSFEEFHAELSALVGKFGGGTQIKVESDVDSEVVKILGERFDQLARAKSGLADLAELPLASAEHHPYWNLLSNCCQICSAVLERWDSELTPEEVEEIRWSVGQLDHACKKLSG